MENRKHNQQTFQVFYDEYCCDGQHISAVDEDDAKRIVIEDLYKYGSTDVSIDSVSKDEKEKGYYWVNYTEKMYGVEDITATDEDDAKRQVEENNSGFVVITQIAPSNPVEVV